MKKTLSCIILVLLANCGGRRSVPVKKMNLDEARQAYSSSEQGADDDFLIKLIPHMLSIETDVHEMANLTLKLADIYLHAGDFVAAQKWYDTFVDKYPGHERIKDGRYRQIVTCWSRSLEPDRDQAITHEVIRLARAYLRDFQETDGQRTKVIAFLVLAYERAMLSELQIARFYKQRYDYDGQKADLDVLSLRMAHLKKEIVQPAARYDKKFKKLLQELEELEFWLEDEHTSDEKAARFERLLNTYLVDDAVRPRDIF